VNFDAHTLLFASLALICGEQAIFFALFTKIFAISEGLMPESAKLKRFFRLVNLERGVIMGCLSLVIGLILLLVAVGQWRFNAFRASRLQPHHEMDHPGRDTYRTRFSNYPRKFCHGHLEDAPLMIVCIFGRRRNDKRRAESRASRRPRRRARCAPSVDE